MPITVTNLTPTRTFDADAVSIDVLADALGTLIEDIEANSYLGSEWTITSGTTDRLLDAESTTVDEVADLIATFVSDNPALATIRNFTILNSTPDDALDCDSTSLTELASLLEALQVSVVPPLSKLRYTIARSLYNFTIERQAMAARQIYSIKKGVNETITVDMIGILSKNQKLSVQPS